MPREIQTQLVVGKVGEDFDLVKILLLIKN